jgi:hypothetical protein
MTALLVAINSVIGSEFISVPLWSSPFLRLALQTRATGEAVRIEYDTTGGGSTANTPLALAAIGDVFTVPSAATYLGAVSPVGGPLDVSQATIRAQLGAGLTDAQVETAAVVIAPKFVETDVAIKSFEVGLISKYLSATYTPDPNRLPPIALGPAIAVVEDDGVTPFVAPVPALTNAQFNTPVPGAITLTGLGLSGVGTPNSEVEETLVRFLALGSTLTLKSLPQSAIITAGGIVSKTSIVIPPAIVPVGVVAGYNVQVLFTSLASNVFTIV